MLDFLKDELRRLGLSSHDYPCDKYISYVQLLSEWNHVYNLTSLKEPNEMISRHIINSLSVLPYIRGVNCLDIGTGAGVPGIILALTQPKKKWFLLDSAQKKVRFLKHIKHELCLENIEIVRCRVEDYKPALVFDTLICRAFAPLDRLLKEVGHLFKDTNQLLAMKGKSVNREIQQLCEHNFEIEIFDLFDSNSASKSKLVRIEHSN